MTATVGALTVVHRLPGRLRLRYRAGLDAAALEQIRANYARDVAILPPDRVAALAEAGGFAPPLRFHQAGMIHGWCARSTTATSPRSRRPNP